MPGTNLTSAEATERAEIVDLSEAPVEYTVELDLTGADAGADSPT